MVMSAQLTEAQLQAHVIALAKMRGWTVFHAFDSRHSAKGFPDLVMIRQHPENVRCECPRHRVTEMVCIELKSERGKVTVEQEMWLDLLRRLPGVKFAGVIKPSQWYEGELDDVLR